MKRLTSEELDRIAPTDPCPHDLYLNDQAWMPADWLTILIATARSEARYAEALNFYADPEVYKAPYDDTGRGPEIYEDAGKTARDALKEQP